VQAILSFTRAAIRLGISQSALSRAIHRLIETLRRALDDVSERLAAVVLGSSAPTLPTNHCAACWSNSRKSAQRFSVRNCVKINR